MHSSRAQTQNKTPTVTRELESAIRIGGTDKSKNQLDDDGKRGWGSGRKRHWQHLRLICVVFSGSGWRQRSSAKTGGYGDRRKRQAVAVAAALVAAVLTGGYGGGGGLWRRRKKQHQAILCLC
jgi:hypothetical protein